MRYRGHEYAVRDGVVLCDGEPITMRALARIGPETALWEWLRECGIQRPRSGPSGAHSSDREALLVRLPRALVARVRAAAESRGVTVLAVVTEALEQATK